MAVVVPSPATSFVLEATSFNSSAPNASNLSLSSISLAIETPSFVIVGDPPQLFFQVPHFFLLDLKLSLQHLLLR